MINRIQNIKEKEKENSNNNNNKIENDNDIYEEFNKDNYTEIKSFIEEIEFIEEEIKLISVKINHIKNNYNEYFQILYNKCKKKKIFIKI
jgi:hypothetical protein